ncbi:MAG: undecaprenyl-diphosphate phosphatase [Oscillospiraceae bacterium]|nr:undecaprenyl-diphosphate phosphatase [Oscillospiraceae bacterium]
MTILAAVLLALAAGITEILPVSGSGHIYLLAEILGVPVTGAAFQSFRAMLLLGVGFAGLLFYHAHLKEMLQENLVLLGVIRPPKRERGVPFGRRLGLLVFMAALPMVLAFFLNTLRKQIETGDYALLYICALLILSGIVLFFTARSARGERIIREMTLHDAILTGIVQILTVFPGLSRSGLVVSVLLHRGMNGTAAAEFAGLLGIPVFLASGLVQLISAGGGTGSLATAPYLILGFALSALVGFFTLRFFTDLMAHRSPTVFAYWSWGAGVLSLILFLISA